MDTSEQNESRPPIEHYRTEEIAGTLFLRKADFVFAANIGEQGEITPAARREFDLICKLANATLDG